MKHYILALLFAMQMCVPAFGATVPSTQAEYAPNFKIAKNFVKNPDCEKGILGIASSTGTGLTQNTASLMDPDPGTKCRWNPGAAATLKFAIKSLPKTIANGNCEANFNINAVTSGQVIAYLMYDSVKVTPNLALNPTTDGPEYTIQYPCGGTNVTTREVVFESLSSLTTPLEVNGVRYGKNLNVGSAAQAKLLGKIRMSGCVDWARSNTAFGSQTATTGCSYTTEGSASQPATQIPAIKLSNVPPGTIQVFARGHFGKTVTSTNAGVAFRFNDGTNTFGEQIAIDAASASGQVVGVGQISGSYTYTAPQSNITIDIQSKVSITTSGSAATISGQDSNNFGGGSINGLEIEVFWFPSTLDQVTSVSQQRAPNIVRYTSGSGTYTPTPGTVYIEVEMSGGGGGGGGSGTAGTTTGGNGGTTTLGSLLSATGGDGGGRQLLNSNGGTPTVTAPASAIVSLAGGIGQGTAYQDTAGTVRPIGGNGGTNPFGGAALSSRYDNAASSAAANTGGGGAGGGCNSVASCATGSGGGAGAYIRALINNPSSMSYAVGVAGTAGAAGTSGIAGGAGAAGVIIITEYFSLNPAIVNTSVLARDNPNGATTVNTIVSKSANYTATDQDETIEADATSGAFTINLPPAASYKGKKYHLIQTGSTTNQVTIDPNGSELVCEQTTVKLTGKDDTLTIQSNGTKWKGLDGTCWKTMHAYINSSCTASPCTINTQSGDIINITRAGAGIYSANYPVGTISALPACTYGALSTAQNSVCKGNGTTSTSTIPIICMNSTTSALADDGFSFNCRGPR
ncbi:MAG: hypothetical protein ACKOX6_11360 [Bdellovibrio sp.]